MLARSGVRTATAALADTALYVQERSRGWTVELLDEPGVISNDFIAGELGIYGTKGRLARVYPYAELKLINPSPAITIMPNSGVAVNSLTPSHMLASEFSCSIATLYKVSYWPNSIHWVESGLNQYGS